MSSCQKQAAAILAKRRARMIAALEDGLNRSVADAAKLADGYSDGAIKQKQLTAWGHPYARRHRAGGKGPSGALASAPTVVLPPEKINEQSGRFRRAWKQVRAQRSGQKLKSQLRNDSPEAKWLKGTSVMVPRPILQAVRQKLLPLFRQNMARASRRGLK